MHHFKCSAWQCNKTVDDGWWWWSWRWWWWLWLWRCWWCGDCDVDGGDYMMMMVVLIMMMLMVVIMWWWWWCWLWWCWWWWLYDDDGNYMTTVMMTIVIMSIHRKLQSSHRNVPFCPKQNNSCLLREMADQQLLHIIVNSNYFEWLGKQAIF